ncbi:sec-independent protein translocase protein TATB, chloroplastic [Rhodamnia argentea]|uniref:Sec-independent protein translocase protein TATB, chloroplastic n=1 Tax=Rhodamnia argentea TaxID=178133 RepID=A0A8B8PSA9_9MYRT|nr:sec-independent protein translocase protein TATB, chloroplastic [Rhodamnia argentea]
MVVASPMPAPAAIFCSSSHCSRPTLCALSSSSSSSSSSVVSCPRASKFGVSIPFSSPSLRKFSPWNGLKHLGISLRPKSLRMGGRSRSKGMVVFASLFGVGAPEALVIGVVALLVFGPKGLAEVARNLGKTLRAFQPTIRELQEVSREFKSTLEKEIGLDENSEQNMHTSSRISASSPPTVDHGKEQETLVDPNGASSPTRAYSSEEYLKITEEQLKASAAPQQRQTMSSEESKPEPQLEQTVTSVPPPSKTENGT